MTAAAQPEPDTELDAPSLTTAERGTAVVLGGLAAVAGVVAVFVSDNELGTAALLLGAILLLVMGVARVVPTGLQAGGQSVTLSQQVRRKAQQVYFEDAPKELQDEVIQSVLTGTTSDVPDSMDAMLTRFMKHQNSEAPKKVYEELQRMDWKPALPGRSTYIRWQYMGAINTVSLYQNSQSLIAASQLSKSFAAGLPGGEVKSPKGEVEFIYVPDPSKALSAARRIAQLADGDADAEG